MKKILIGIIIGLVTATALLIPLLLKERREEFENGKHQGRITGGLEVFKFLDKHFYSKSAPSSEPTHVFHFKDRSLYIIEKDNTLIVETE